MAEVAIAQNCHIACNKLRVLRVVSIRGRGEFFRATEKCMAHIGLAEACCPLDGGFVSSEIETYLSTRKHTKQEGKQLKMVSLWRPLSKILLIW